MDKATFLVQLQKNIGMLDDGEQKDIIDEYSQHIDMKVSGGMTEAEAIEDFGDFNEFVREVLSAYHVKAPFDQADAAEATAATAQPTAGDRLDDAVRGGAQAAGRAVDATKRGVRKMASAVSGAAGKLSGRAKESASQAGVARAKSRTKAAAADTTAAICEADAQAAASTAGDVAGAPRGVISSAGDAMRSFGKICWSATKTLARWCWNFAVVCLAAAGGFMALVSLFCLGLGVVFLLQGYPVAGLTIAAAGCGMAFAAIAFLLSRLIMRKRMDEASACEAVAPGASGSNCGSGGSSSSGLVEPGADAPIRDKAQMQDARPSASHDPASTAPLAFSRYRGDATRERDVVMGAGFDPRGFDGGRFSTAPMGAVAQVCGKGAFYE